MAVQGEDKQVTSGSSRAIEAPPPHPPDAELPSSSVMAAQGKDKLVPPCPTSRSGPVGKRSRTDHDEEPSPSSSAAAKRHHRPGVHQFRVAAARVSDEREEREDLQSEEDLDDDGVGTSETKARARTGEGATAAGVVGPQEQRERQLQSNLLLSEIMKLKKNDELLIPFADFLRLVKEITGCHSREVSRWTPKALLSLHEAAEDYLLEVFDVVNQSDTDVPAQPNLWYGDDTKLTPEQEAAARGFSRAFTSGIPTYICTMKTSNVMKRQLAFSREFSKRYILPQLGYDCCETRVFAGCNRFSSKLNFSMIHGELRLLGGWPLFVKENRIKAGHVCAFIFEEKEEAEDGGALLSLRVHMLGTVSIPTV